MCQDYDIKPLFLFSPINKIQVFLFIGLNRFFSAKNREKFPTFYRVNTSLQSEKTVR